MTVRALAFVLVASAASRAVAGPLDAGVIPADARWYAHLDLEAARAASVAPAVYERWLSRGEAHDFLETVRAAIGTDLLEDLTGATLYGRDFGSQAGVLLARGKLDSARVLELLARNATHTSSSYREHELHTWTQTVDDELRDRLTGCFARPNLVVLARRASAVRAALDVIDERSPHLASSDSGGRPPEAGTVFHAAVPGLRHVPETDLSFVSPVLRQSESIALSAGEEAGDVFVRVRLETDSAATAASIAEVFRGLRAMALLRYGQDDGLKRALDAVAVETSGSRVTVDWRHAGEPLMDLIERRWRQAHGQR